MNSTTQSSDTKEQKPNRRWFLLKIVLLIVILATIIVVCYYYFFSRWYESTDNAYVSANIVQITPQVTGTVVAIDVDDGDYVKTGQPLIRLDPAETDVALNQARANLASAVRQVRGLYRQASGSRSGTQAQEAIVKSQEAAVKVAKSALDRAKSDDKRRQSLVASGAISGEEFAHFSNIYQQALSQYQSSLSQLEAARQQLREIEDKSQVSIVLVDNTKLENHPDVLAAVANLKTAYLNNVRSNIQAPIDGYIAKRSVQIGQRVNASSPLMAVIPLDKVWVSANYKETQMRKMRIGQAVKIQADLYGSSVVYDGVITNLGIGTGSTFSLLPAQNATGNWIKIVQRIPVRIDFKDPEQLRKNPLRVGMSLTVETNLHQTKGAVLSQGINPVNLQETTIYQQQMSAAQRLADEIIQANAGQTEPSVDNHQSP